MKQDAASYETYCFIHLESDQALKDFRIGKRPISLN
jgi:hypothetical protein